MLREVEALEAGLVGELHERDSILEQPLRRRPRDVLDVVEDAERGSHAATLRRESQDHTDCARRRSSSARSAALRGQADRGVVGVDRLVVAAETAQQVGAGGVEQVVAGEVEALDRRRAPPRGRRPRRRAMARLSATTGVGACSEQLVVERDDLRPVGVVRGRRRRCAPR